MHICSATKATKLSEYNTSQDRKTTLYLSFVIKGYHCGFGPCLFMVESQYLKSHFPTKLEKNIFSLKII